MWNLAKILGITTADLEFQSSVQFTYLREILYNCQSSVQLRWQVTIEPLVATGDSLVWASFFLGQLQSNTIIPYSTLISRNLNFADSCLQRFPWINFAVPFPNCHTYSVFHAWYMVYTYAHTPYYHAHKLIWQLFICASRSKSEAKWWRWLQPRTIRKLWITVAWINSWKVLQ